MVIVVSYGVIFFFLVFGRKLIDLVIFGVFWVMMILLYMLCLIIIFSVVVNVRSVLLFFVGLVRMIKLMCGFNSECSVIVWLMFLGLIF